MTPAEMKANRAGITSLEKDRRRHLSALFNGTSNTKRHRIYSEFGYPKHLTFDDFFRAYTRNAVAGAAVERVNDGCFEDYPNVFEGTEKRDAENESAWDKAAAALLKRCWKQIKGADKRNLIGRYSALLIQVRDSTPWNEEINAATVKSLGDKALVKLIPVWEPQLDVSEWDDDPMSETFGEPKMYTFTELPVENVNNNTRPARDVQVHPSRVIILAEGADDGYLTSGVSLLEKGMNKILDIEKVSGGAAEGFLKNASRQLNYSFSEKTDFKKLAAALGTTEAHLADALDEQVKRLNDSTDSASFMQAGTAEVLSVAPADPEPTWRTALNEFAATVPIPVKILIGMQTGERASVEDARDWAKTRMSRRKGFLNDVITELVKRFWTYGFLPVPQGEEITVDWTDLLAASDAEKLDNMSKLADVAQKTMTAFGRAAINENEIRAAGELEPVPDMDKFDAEEPPEQIDPLTGKPIATGKPTANAPNPAKPNRSGDDAGKGGANGKGSKR